MDINIDTLMFDITPSLQYVMPLYFKNSLVIRVTCPRFVGNFTTKHENIIIIIQKSKHKIN